MHARMGSCLLGAAKLDPLGFSPLPNLLLIQGNQSHQMPLAIADDHDLTEQRIRLEQVLDHLWSHLLAARRDDQVFLAVGDAEKSLTIDLSDIARMKPPIPIDGLFGRLRIPIIALKDIRSPKQDLAILANAALHPVQRQPNGAESVAI